MVFSHNISHALRFLTEQLGFAVPLFWSLLKKGKHVPLILTCVINTRQLSDVTASPRVVHHAVVSFRTGAAKFASTALNACAWICCLRIHVLIIATVKWTR